MHNLVHLLTGAAFLFGGLVLEGKEDVTLKTVTAALFRRGDFGVFDQRQYAVGFGPH